MRRSCEISPTWRAGPTFAKVRSRPIRSHRVGTPTKRGPNPDRPLRRKLGRSGRRKSLITVYLRSIFGRGREFWKFRGGLPPYLYRRLGRMRRNREISPKLRGRRNVPMGKYGVAYCGSIGAELRKTVTNRLASTTSGTRAVATS